MRVGKKTRRYTFLHCYVIFSRLCVKEHVEFPLRKMLSEVRTYLCYKSPGGSLERNLRLLTDFHDILI